MDADLAPSLVCFLFVFWVGFLCWVLVFGLVVSWLVFLCLWLSLCLLKGLLVLCAQFCVVEVGGFILPLTDRVAFRAVVEVENRVQVPRIIRWRFKLETDQALTVTVSLVDSFGGKERFYARMRKDGRITIPKVAVDLLQRDLPDGHGLVGAIIDVQLEPA